VTNDVVCISATSACAILVLNIMQIVKRVTLEMHDFAYRYVAMLQPTFQYNTYNATNSQITKLCYC